MIDAATWRAKEPAKTSLVAGVLQIEWLPDRRTGGALGQRELDHLLRRRPRRGPDRTAADVARDRRRTPTFLVPGPADEVAVLGDHDRVMSYPVAPSAWLRTACAIVGRDLTRAEWDRYLPARPYTATCSDLG